MEHCCGKGSGTSLLCRDDFCRRNHSSLRRRRLESDAEDRRCYGHCRRYYFPLPQRRIESDAEPRSRHGRCMRAILYRHNDCAASIPKFGLEIKNRCTQEGVNREKLASIRKSGLEINNRCTQEGVNREKLASIRKSGLEIKNQCTKEGVNGEKLTSIRKSGLEIKNRCRKQPIFSTHPQHAFHNALTTRLALDVLHRQCFVAVRQWRQKRVLMRPEAAFPYVFAAEGAQHPPIGRHAQRSPQRKKDSISKKVRSSV